MKKKKKYKTKANIADLKNVIKSLNPKRRLEELSIKNKKKYEDEDLDDAIIIVD